MNVTLRMLELGDEKVWKELLRQLNSEKKPKAKIANLISDPNFFGIMAQYRQEVIGFGSISFFQSSFKGIAGVVEDVIVDEEFQDHKVGSKILDALILEAKRRNTDCIVLTSRPDKVRARRLYESRGFVLSDTGFFTKNL